MNYTVNTIEGRNILVAEGNGQVALSSMYHDIYADLWAKGHESDYYRARYFIFGLGDGSFLDALLSRADDDAAILVVEPSGDLYDVAKKNFDLGCLKDGRVRFLLSPTMGAIKSAVSGLLSYTDTDGVRICTYPNYTRLFPEAYIDFRKAILEASNTCAFSYEMARRHGMLIAENALSNLAYLNRSYSLDALKDIFNPDMPVVVAASGPSLNDSLDMLSRVKGHLPIISVDSALPTLLGHDVIPDYFISVDPFKEAEIFADDRIKDIPCILSLTSRSFLVKNHRAPIYFFNDKDRFLDKLGLPILSSDGSVANNAFGALQYLGVRRVIFTGLDLGYPGGATHAKGAAVHTDVEDDLIAIESNSGASLHTNQGMNLYRQLLEKNITDGKTALITTSKNGAKIAGASYLPFDEAVGGFESFTYNAEKPSGCCCADIHALIARSASALEAFASKLDNADLDTLKGCYAMLISNPHLYYAHIASLNELDDMTRRLFKKEGATFELMKYRRYFKVVSDTIATILKMEHDLIG